jgi:hypothetical protein
MDSLAAAPNPGMFDVAGDDLVDALNLLDVPFLAGGSPDGQPSAIPPGLLLIKLAASPEARLRLALIPLLLRHAEFVAHVDSALVEMPASALIGFKCYYAAAVLLQRKYWERLQNVVAPNVLLPPRFLAELAIPYPCNPDAGLKLLATCQASLTGRHINWLGTYEHAAQRFLTHIERQVRWKV